MPNRTARAAFLLCLAHTGNVTIAAEFSGLSRAAAYQQRKQDTCFARAWDEALAESDDRLNYVAWQRAVEGVEVDVYFHGERVGSRRHYSDRLLVLLIRHALGRAAQSGSASLPDRDNLYAEFEARLAALAGGDDAG